MSKKRRNHSLEFKAKVALAALKGDESLTALSQRYQINSNLIVKWKCQDSVDHRCFGSDKLIRARQLMNLLIESQTAHEYS